MTAKWTRSTLAHPIITSFVVALIARVCVATGINLLFGGFLFLDDLTYHQMASDLVRDLHMRWDPYTQFLFNTTATFLIPLTFLYELFGPRILIGQLWVAVLGAGTAAFVGLFLFDLTDDRRWALLGGVVVGLLPSQVLWSSLVLKDAAVWFLLVALAVAVQRAQRATAIALLVTLFACGTLLFALAYLRPHTMVVAAFAMAVAFIWSPREARAQRAGAGLLLALFIPWAAGYGLLGTTLIFNGQSLHERRMNNAAGAASAFVQPSPSDREGGTSRSGSDTPSRELEDTDTLEADIAHLPRGLTYILLAPFPWEDSSSTGMTLARIESLLWYPLLALGLIGAVLSLRLRSQRLSFPLLSGTGSVFVYALTEGNVGTAYRHRGEFVWAVVIFAVVALRHLWQTKHPQPDP